MAFRWVCNRCGQLHGSNPSKCGACGSTVLTPISRATVAEQTNNPREVESLDPDEILTYGTTPDPDFPSSPDVAPDGSIGSEETSPLGNANEDAGHRRRGFSAFVIIGGLLLLCLLLLVLLLSL